MAEITVRRDGANIRSAADGKDLAKKGIHNMKKNHLVGKIFILTVIVLLATAFSLYVSADDFTHSDHSEGIAVRTSEELSQMEAGKFYYLDSDITISEAVKIEGEIHLCLNGKVLKYENDETNGSVFYIGKEGVLRILDCSDETHNCIADKNGLWSLTDESGAEGRKEIKGGVIIGGTGEKREIGELKDSYFCGGFAYVDGGSLFVYGGNIVGNKSEYGGAVYVTGEGHFEMNGGAFRGNLADFRGGAIFVHSGTMLLNEGSVSENKAVKNGGGIDISGESILEMHGGSVVGNTAGAWSGGIENFGMFDMYGGTISGNSASEDAGGVYNGGAFTMHGGVIRENSATYGGGVCNDGKMTIHDGTILANLAQESGGGLYNADRLVINGGKIASNTAVTSGGGIENDGTCIMYGGSIGGSLAEDANMAYLGGGVCVYKGSFTMYGGTIERNTGVDGGGVENEAIFALLGGTVTYNYAAMQGGGMTNRGELILGDGARIVSNASGTNEGETWSGGIYWIVEENTSVSVSGAVTVTDNTTNGELANFVICGKGSVSFSDFSERSQIGFTLLNGKKNLTSGTVALLAAAEEYEAEKLLSSFTSDRKNFELQFKNGEIILLEKNFVLMLGVAIVFVSLILVAVLVGVILARKKKRDRFSISKKFKKRR